VFQRTTQWLCCVLAASGLLSACAAPAPHADAGAAAAHSVGPVEVGVGGALPLFQTRSDPVLASRVGVGGGDAPLQYTARYTVLPGDVFADTAATPGAAPPQRLGSQRLGQELALRMPPLAGAPVGLEFSAESREHWTTAGHSVGQQRQAAALDWSPGLASLNLQWLGGAAANDAQLALGCELRGTLEVPLQGTAAAGAQALRLSGRECSVLAPDDQFDALAAQAWGVAWAWSGRKRDTEVLLSVIEPAWKDESDRQEIDPSYEFGVRHRREHGRWSAQTKVAMRYTTAWDLSAPDDTGDYAGYSEAFWTASASLTRHLPVVSLSAKWAHSADPMWFMPEIGQRKHRVDMHLDLSRLVAALVPDATPQLGVQWNWSQARSRADDITGDTMVRLNMAVTW
jgi:hypothetical protein